MSININSEEELTEYLMMEIHQVMHEWGYYPARIDEAEERMRPEMLQFLKKFRAVCEKKEVYSNG